MNRVEFMTELAKLLQDISVEERREAMQYYNDYFDDAGEKSEEEIVEELGSPAKVAAAVKAGLKGGEEETGEFRETGYTDTRFEEKETPAMKAETGGQTNQGSSVNQEPPHTSKVLKVVLIILICMAAAPIVLPLVVGLIAVVIAIIITLFAVFVSLVIASASVVIAGICVFWSGLMALVPELAVGLALMGTGIILTVLGVIATVASVKLCMIVFPGIIRGIVWLIRWPFYGRRGKAVA